jgi:hypothetical protein
MTNAKAASTSRRAGVFFFVIGAFILMQVILVAVAKHDTLIMNTWPNTNPSPDFWGACDIGQTFVSSSPNIGRIDLFFGTHGRSASYRIGFELFEAGAPPILLAASGIEASALRNNLFNEIRFPTVRGTRGKRLYFRLLAPEATAADAMALWMNTGDILPDGAMIYNGAPASGDIIFRVYARRTILSELGRIVAGNPGLLGRPALFVVVILLLEAAFIWALAAIVDRILERRDADG